MEKLIELERTARLDKNEELQKNIFTEMTQLCESDDDLINLQILLSKRKGQLLHVFSWFVSYNFQRKKVYYENINKPDSQEKLIRYAECILKEVIEGNMFLERERIMISSFLKDCYEKKGELKKAMDIIFEVPIETFSNVSECEVIKYQLEQLRLAVINKDWIRAEVSSKKIRSKYFTEKKDLKKEIVYLSLLTDMNLGQKMYFNAAKLLYEMSEKSDSSNNYIFLSSFYTVISDKSKERDDFFNKLIYNQSNTESIRKILYSFLKTELLVKENIFFFKEYVDLNIFEKEIIRALDVHNLTVISKYCTFINLSELAVLLKCDTQELIDKICYVVNNKLLQCKISEDDGLIMFNTNLQGNWIESITDILDKIVEVNHLIEDEYMKNKE